MSRAVPLAFALAACAPEIPERFLVMDGRRGDYALEERDIPELDDPVRMRGALGDGRTGGYLGGDLRGGDLYGATYRGGGALGLEYVVQDGLAVPLHADGMELFTYYHSLSALRADLDAVGIDTDGAFPVPFAYQPLVAGVTLSSNAAYVSGGVHLFVLLPGASTFDVPLAANPGIIRHEFGHALFSDIVSGGVHTPSPQVEIDAVRALNEGFADMVATLSLDDAVFIELSGAIAPERDVRGDWTVADASDPEVDPYSRGTVYASFAWDVRERTDAGRALRAVVDALAIWSASAPWVDGQAGVDRYPTVLLERVVAEDPALTSSVCAAWALRFEGLPRPAVCP